MLQRILILMTYTIPYFEKKPAAPGISIGRLIATSTESKIVPIIIKTTYAEQPYSLSVELDNSTVIAGGELKAKIILKNAEARPFNAIINYFVSDSNNNIIYREVESLYVDRNTISKYIRIPENAFSGKYALIIDIVYGGGADSAASFFSII